MKLLKLLCIALAIFVGRTQAQNTEAKITFGNKKTYQPLVDNGRYSFTAYNNNYYVFMQTISMEKNFSVVVCDDNNNVITDAPIKINAGVWGNETTIEKIIGYNNKAYLLICNTNKKTGKNRLIAKQLQPNLMIDETEIELASFDYKKTMNAGNWIISISPDQKHLLVLGETPYEEKEIPSKLIFNYFDLNLKSEKAGEIILPGENKKYNLYSAYLANNANLFLVRKEMARNGSQAPTIFSTNILSGAAPTLFAPQVGEGKSLFSYACSVLQNNSFTMAGYYDERKKISSGDPITKGCFYYNTQSCNEIKLTPLLTPTENLTALNIIENENLVYMVAESFKEKSESVPGQMGVYKYSYTHKDINVLGFENDGNKKIDITLNRNYDNVSFDGDLTPVAGIIKNKLAILYIDNYGKYASNQSYNNYKVPVMVYINNNGLMESTLHFEKEFSTTTYSINLFSKIPMQKNNKMQLLMLENGTHAKAFSVE